MTMREKIWRLISPEDGGLSWFNWAIIVLIGASLVLLALETEPAFNTISHATIVAANRTIVVIFAAEYAARLWVCGVDRRWSGVRGHVRYVVRPQVVADFLAFAPELVVVLLFPEAAREAMLLRAFRVVRLFRLFSFFPALRRMGRAIVSVGPQLIAALGVAVMTIFMAACVLYFAEAGAQPETFGSIPRALWWAVATLTTVGYGDAYPITAWGKIAAGMAAITGVGVVALPAGILAGAFAEEFKKHAPPPPPDEDK